MCSKDYSKVNAVKCNPNTISTVTFKAMDALATIAGKSTQSSPCKTLSHTYTYSHREWTKKV